MGGKTQGENNQARRLPEHVFVQNIMQIAAGVKEM